ncbi:hypothetical protein CALVIDRAFT_525434 [Calocera viscosa TUFC12733]|uniref:Nucleolar protein 16 n=1 Tax=Calocera viscosa (strain TUFC12733) TaxID=1330018 RepID=A0A167Q4K1_CALVF|nr:hypothetical protein CALVIDRAFT_525434 [Calocera viscosa TUFC12733]
MANPRQRRKARSSSYRTVKTSNAKKLRKHPALNAPDVLKKAWDVHKTVRQNYAALGLAPSLAPRPSGGTENGPARQAGHASDAAENVIVDPAASAPGQGAIPAGSLEKVKPLPKGFGRIVRDKDGKVVDVVLPEDEEEEDGDVEMDAGAGAVSRKGRKGKAQEEETPWGLPMEDWVPDSAEVADRVVGAQKTKRTAVTDELEKLAAQTTKISRHASSHEVELLRALIQVHGDDVEAMSRDRKLNRWQKTAGELRRAIKKAGGETAILAAGAEA